MTRFLWCLMVTVVGVTTDGQPTKIGLSTVLGWLENDPYWRATTDGARQLLELGERIERAEAETTLCELPESHWTALLNVWRRADLNTLNPLLKRPFARIMLDFAEASDKRAEAEAKGSALGRHSQATGSN